MRLRSKYIARTLQVVVRDSNRNQERVASVWRVPQDRRWIRKRGTLYQALIGADGHLHLVVQPKIPALQDRGVESWRGLVVGTMGNQKCVDVLAVDVVGDVLTRPFA